MSIIEKSPEELAAVAEGSVPGLVRCDCGRVFETEDDLHTHWIVYMCDGPSDRARVAAMVESTRKKYYKK